jgi:serine phosphatase RsbU (regulator of sigma subunit)
MQSAPAPVAEAASLIVVDPSGHRSRVPLDPLPFRIGRHADNHLILRDSRASRSHARIAAENGAYWLEDCGSRHGTFLNGKRVERAELHNSDRIDFGTQDSYQLIFALDGAELKRLMDQVAGPEKSGGHPAVGGNMAKLRAILDLARTLQSSFSVDDVLTQVVDAALAIAGAERGFLLLRGAEGLDMRVARHRKGHKLRDTDLRVPREVLHRALQHRRELLSMNFDPVGADTTTRPQNSIADLELRSVICVPLVRIRAGQGDATSVLVAGAETVGLLYMDSRVAAADLAGGNRELLQTLAIEASTVLENARLLEEERAKHQMDEEMRLARTIQQSLLPRTLPEDGWLRACGSSVASRQVGGDYFDVTQVNPHCWSAVVADVSGKGVASALLASLIQGALLTATDHPPALGHRAERLNRFLLDRTGGEKYATVFYGLMNPAGEFSYVNAGHCAPYVVTPGGECRTLETTAMPVGLLEGAEFAVATERLAPGDKVVIYSDGVSEAQNTAGEFFGRKRLRQILTARAAESCRAMHDAIHDGVAAFTEGAPQSDDITVLVLEFAE